MNGLAIFQAFRTLSLLGAAALLPTHAAASRVESTVLVFGDQFFSAAGSHSWAGESKGFTLPPDLFSESGSLAIAAHVDLSFRPHTFLADRDFRVAGSSVRQFAPPRRLSDDAHGVTYRFVPLNSPYESIVQVVPWNRHLRSGTLHFAASCGDEVWPAQDQPRLAAEFLKTRPVFENLRKHVVVTLEPSVRDWAACPEGITFWLHATGLDLRLSEVQFKVAKAEP